MTSEQYIAEMRAEIAKLRAALDKAKRIKWWRTRYEYRALNGDWVETTSEWTMSLAEASREARGMRKDRRNYRSVRVFRVYRRAKS